MKFCPDIRSEIDVLKHGQRGPWVRDEGALPQRWDNLGHRCSEMDRGYLTLPYLTRQRMIIDHDPSWLLTTAVLNYVPRKAHHSHQCNDSRLAKDKN